MELEYSGISNVRAFELPCGVWAAGEYIAQPRVTLVRWESWWDDKFYQVYVNGEFSGATVSCQQRQMVVQVPWNQSTASKIEVFAVERDAAYIDFGGELSDLEGERGRVKINILRTQDLPFEGRIEVYSDQGTGQIDYDNAIDSIAIPVWPFWQYKGGFGMSKFGHSDFGFDWSAGIGFGKGSFGNGQFGVGADVIEWISPPLSPGVYKFGLKISDKFGNEGFTETGEVVVIPSPQPAEGLGVYSYESDGNHLVLKIA